MTLFTQTQNDTRTDRQRFTDSIKTLVEMATEQGSSNSRYYYTSISKLIKGITGIEDRNAIMPHQKTLERTLQSAVRGEVYRGTELGIYYKNIYKNIKKKLLGIERIFRS